MVMNLLFQIISEGRAVTVEGNIVSLEYLLIFFSGADREPPLGFPVKPNLRFITDADQLFPTASTCSLELWLPTKYTEYAPFQDAMITALMGHGGFGVV